MEKRKAIIFTAIAVAVLVTAMSMGCVDQQQKEETKAEVKEALETVKEDLETTERDIVVINESGFIVYYTWEDYLEAISATPTPTDQELIDKALEELPTGKILFNPPKEMKVGDTELVEVRITQNISEDLTKGLKGRGDPLINETTISTYMKVRLTGMNFDIDPQNGATQIIESDKYTEWRFHVTPLKSGIQTLRLTYYVILSIPGYDDRKKEYEVGDWEINVIVTLAWFLKCNWQFIVVTLLTMVGLIIAVIAIRKKR
jgi:hypothetical protein